MHACEGQGSPTSSMPRGQVLYRCLEEKGSEALRKGEQGAIPRKFETQGKPDL